MKTPLISIIIPTYELYGEGVDYLHNSLSSVFMQTYKDYEIIVSDHSQDSKIEDFVRSLNKEIIYDRYDKKRGNPSANLNNAISLASGDIIKPLFQDEMFYSDLTLQCFADALKSYHWAACGRREDGQSFIPIFTKSIRHGKNKLSSPSCIAYRKNKFRWDENLISLLDCDFYYRLFQKYGLPKIIPYPLVCIKPHKYQLTNTMSWDDKMKEKQVMLRRYGH